MLFIETFFLMQTYTWICVTRLREECVKLYFPTRHDRPNKFDYLMVLCYLINHVICINHHYSVHDDRIISLLHCQHHAYSD